MKNATNAMKKMTAAIVAIISLGALGLARQPGPVEALDGVDPVLLVQGKEVSGRAEFKAVHGPFEYLFSSAATKAEFERNPARYEIQMGGLCARMGKATGGRPSDYLVYDRKIYIFGSDDCHRKFEAEPKKYLAAPVAPVAGSPKAIREGLALVARAVAALGGAARLDGLTTYAETASQVQQRPTGDVPITTKTMWRFPGDVRMERTMVSQDGTTTRAMLLTPSGMWFLGQGRAYPVVDAGRPSLELDYGRQIVPLLRGWHAAGFKAVSLGPAIADGVNVERVRIANGGVDVTAGIEASGRIHSISFTDRNSEGEVGEFTIVYTDYRAADGLTVPFVERAVFNGAPDGSLTRRLEAVAVNPPLDATLFQVAAAGGR